MEEIPSFVLQYQACDLISLLEELPPVLVLPLEQERLQDQLGI